MPAVSAMPTTSDPLAVGPAYDACADRINYSGDLMSRNSRVLNTRIGALFGKRVAVTDATRLDLDAHLPCGRLRDFALDQFKGAIGLGNLHNSHLRHIFLDSHSSNVSDH